MNKDFEEILRIITLFGENEISDEDALFILTRISEETYDALRSDKHDFACQNRGNLIAEYKRYLGVIGDSCSEEDCENCLINKWCNHYRNKAQQRDYQRIAYTYADFFCGAGGLSWGFHRAGYKMGLANDIQECCIDTLALNHPEVPGQHLARNGIDEIIQHISDISRYDEIDVVIGGPPCQGFSMANRQRLIDDPRNRLYKSFIEAISVIQPKFFVMENVRGMLNVKDQIIEDFQNIGYSASARLFNAIDFGVPQNRERVIFIGNCIGLDNEIVLSKVAELGSSEPKRVLRDIMAGLPKLEAKKIPNATEQEDDKTGYTIAIQKSEEANAYIERINEGKNSCLLFNHKARYNNSRDIEIFSRMNPGDNSADPKIADIMPYKRREKIFKDKYFRLEPDKPSKTITAHMKYDCNMYIHPFEARGLTPREAARIQSYPDYYFFRGSYTMTYMQVGNSVPPLLGEAIAKSLVEFMEEKNDCI